MKTKTMKRTMKTTMKHEPKALKKQMKGFAVMSAKRRRGIASMGGQAVSQQRGSRWMAKLGKIGGLNSHRNTNGKA